MIFFPGKMSNTQLVWAGIKSALEITSEDFDELSSCIKFHRKHALFTENELLYKKFNYNKLLLFSVSGNNVYSKDNICLYNPIKWCVLDRIEEIPSELEENTTNPDELLLNVILNEEHQINGEEHIFDIDSITDDSLATLVYCNCTGSCTNSKLYDEWYICCISYETKRRYYQ